MLRTTLIILLFVAAGCSSPSKSGEGEVAATSSEVVAPAAMSESEILERYTLVELNGAANALKVINDQSLAAKSDAQGEVVLGCPVPGDRARSLLLRLRPLVEARTKLDTAEYQSDPAGYAKAQGFESCAASCSCGVLASVIDKVDASSVRKFPARIHERYLTRMQSKAARQGIEASLMCARKQTWFCKSDLRTFLEAPIK